MMTYNEKNRWVFPLVQTACAYTKVNDCFRKMKQGEIEVSHVQGDFGDHFGSSESEK